MPGPCPSPLDKFDAMQMCFASGSVEKRPCLRNLLTRTSDFDFLLSRERCPVTAGQAVRQGTRGCRKEPEGIRRSFLRKYAPQLVAAKQMDLPLPA